MNTDYDRRYQNQDFFWGQTPSSMCYRVLELAPPIKPLRLLEVGCGEGKDALFFARNGYSVTAFDYSQVGVDKAAGLAQKLGLKINFFAGDINAVRLDQKFDIIFSSGALQYIRPELRSEVLANYKAHTEPGGLHVLHTFVSKPFVKKAPDAEANETPWSSGELMQNYHDWLIEWSVEEIKACNSSGVPHQHAHNRIIARYFVDEK